MGGLHSEEGLFAYTQLDIQPASQQIRLLRILPAADHFDELHCEVFQTSLEKLTQYEALSYAWGDPSITLPIWVDNGRFLVTANLESALRYFRFPTKERILWVDAVCINQDNATEKSHQVGMMREIYTKATQVVVWLGNEEYAGVALGFLTKVDKEYREIENDTNRNFAGFLNSLREEDNVKWEACEALFLRRAWWRRTWVLQEVIHPGSVLVHAGTITIQLDTLCDMYESWFFANSFRLAYDLGNVHGYEAELRRNMNRNTLSELLRLTRALGNRSNHMNYDASMDTLDRKFLSLMGSRNYFSPPATFSKCRSLQRDQQQMFSLTTMLILSHLQEASDPRDKIYALLGISSDASRLSIPIDYNCSTEATFESATRAILTHDSLEVLLMVETKDRQLFTQIGLPSWVPDFTAKRDLISYTMVTSVPGKAAPQDTPQLRFTSDGGQSHLVLTGVYVAVVTEVFVTNIGGKDRAIEASEMVKLIKYEEKSTKRLGLGLFKNKNWSRRNKQKRQTIMNSSWGPMRTEIGDIIIVARGSRLPLVLRRCQNFYLFVGGCVLIDRQSRHKEFPNNPDDPCFSKIMRGSVWDEVGKSLHEEEFIIH